MERAGEQIRLREWKADEAEAMHSWLGDPRVTRFLAWAPTSFEGSVEHLRRCVEAQTQVDRRKFFLAIERLSDGTVLGDAGCEWRHDESGRPQVAFGYFLAYAHWGRGHATEAARLVLDLAFCSLGAESARASCDSKNVASERVLQKCGLARQPAEETPGRRVYRVAREQWFARSSAARRSARPPAARRPPASSESGILHGIVIVGGSGMSIAGPAEIALGGALGVGSCR